MSLPRYPKYKDSGVEWLGKVPEHWPISRLGFESWVRARLGWKGLKADEYADDGFIFLSTPNIKETGIDFENVNYITEDRYEESPEIRLRVGDVVLAKDGSTLGTVNVVRFLPRPATVNSSIAVITPQSSLDGVFLYYLFQSSFMKATIQRIKGGMGVPHLFQADLTKFYMPAPPVYEQMQIATFLDQETVKIDALVEEQRRLIELLKEKRQAVISHAVTKGLNPDVPMKDSGIEWLGKVPKHWRVKRLKQIIEVGSSISYGIVQPGEPQDEGVPFIQTTNISSGNFLIDSLQKTTTEIANSYPRSRLCGGEVVLGIRASIGAAFVVPDYLRDANLSRGVARIACGSQVSSTYLVWILRSDSTLNYWQLSKQGSTFNEVSIETVRELAFAVPPDEEQSEITAFLDGELAKLNELTAKATYAIDLLQERRTALISAAVTGKVDVHGLAKGQVA
jgi:type I restriction enzyme S subunit